MKLSMAIFAEHLEEFHPTADIRDHSFDIEAVRLFSSNVTLEKNTMYIGHLKDLFINGNDHIICAHRNNLIQLDTTDLESVLNNVLNTLSLYTNWDNAMMTQLTEGAMLQDLLDTSESILGHPVFLLDSSQRHLCHAQSYGPGSVDEMWDAILQKGACNLDFLINFNRHDPHRSARKGIYSYEEPYFPHVSYHYNFNYQNNFLGSATYIMEDDRPATQGALDRFLLYCRYVERWFQLHIQEQDSIILDSLILASITNAEYDAAELQRRLRLRDWQEEDQLLFYKIDAPLQPYSINSHLVQTLNIAFPLQHAVNTDLSICLLCNLTKQPRADLEKELSHWLDNSNYYATAGLPFTLKDSFYEHYQYVNLVSDYSDHMVGKIYEGKQYTLPYLFRKMQDSVLPTILHPAIRELQEYDQKHHTDFYHTLYVYLQCSQNIARTAQALHLHRNTLLYRLDRLRELITDDLDVYRVRLHLMISYEIAGEPTPGNAPLPSHAYTQ